MSKAVYITTTESHSGKSLVSLGLMRMLLAKTPRVGYFRPIIDDVEEGKMDNHIETFLSYFHLDIPYEDVYCFQRSEVNQLKTEGKTNFIIDKIITGYKKLQEQFDFILVEGTDFTGDGAILEFSTNVDIAKNLGIPVIIVSNGEGKTIEDIVSNMHMAFDTFYEDEVKVLAMIVNKANENSMEEITNALDANITSDAVIDVVPLVNSLAHPTMKEIVDYLDARVIFGEKHLNNQVGSYGVGAMQLDNYLTHIKDQNLVVTPGDRSDIILGALQANMSFNYPRISGMILTGNILPEKSILDLIEGLSNVVPIASVKEGTFHTANKVGDIKSKIYKGNKDKILVSLSTFDKFVSYEEITKKLVKFSVEKLTPRMFQYNLLQKAKSERKTIVLPEGNDIRILRAANQIAQMDVLDLILIGDKKEINSIAAKSGLKLDYDTIQIINPQSYVHFDDYVQTLYELRKHKNVNLDMAKDMVSDVSYFGTMMILKGHADGMVSGAVHTTQHTIRPALQLIKTKPGVSVVSSVFFMCLPDRVSVFGDCAVNPNPNAEQLAEIAMSSAISSSYFGINPKVAMLSYSSGSSGKGEEVEKVRKATDIVKTKLPELLIEGPIQYDAAVDANVGKSKLPNSKVAGQANVLIFPDLNTGNNTYKAVQRETGALAIGPMLQGLNKPVNDLSRGCTVEDVYNTILLTAVQAQQI